MKVLNFLMAYYADKTENCFEASRRESAVIRERLQTKAVAARNLSAGSSKSLISSKLPTGFYLQLGKMISPTILPSD